MNVKKPTFSVKRNFLVLLFLLLSLTTIFCCFVILIPGIVEGNFFEDSKELGLALFTIFILPFIVGAITSAVILLLSLIARQAWWISLPVSIVLLGAPQLAYALVWAASWVARFFYEPTPEDEARTKSFFGMAIVKEQKIEDETAKLRQMKLLLDDGILTQAEFDAQKNQYLARYEAEQKQDDLPRLFSIWQVALAALLGGLVSGAILMALNYRRLKDNQQMIISFLAGAVGQFLVFVLTGALIYMIPDINSYLLFSINFIYPLILYLWYSETQRTAVNELLFKREAVGASWWLTILIGLTCGAFFALCSFPFLALLGALVFPAPLP
ncbi:MAG: SHOCT domain-containing protein [Anaerolineales bacterium]|nr:SHOCT domain-containing protein [Anaerolineales bacterium]